MILNNLRLIISVAFKNKNKQPKKIKTEITVPVYLMCLFYNLLNVCVFIAVM